jgi:hypothetical protein
VLVIFVKVQGEGRAINFFRRTENGINSEVRERKIKEVTKNLDYNIHI